MQRIATPEELNKLKEISFPLAGVTAGLNSKDLAVVKESIGDATIVGLGESSHGTREFFQMKHRLFEYLAKEKDFTLFVIEASMADCDRVNEYVLHGKGDSKALLEDLHFWTWNTQEVLTMIKWMRKYNKTAATKLQFTGCDMQDPHLSAEIIQKNLEKAEYQLTIESPKNLAKMLVQLRGQNNPPLELNEEDQKQYDALLNNIKALQGFLLQEKVTLEQKLGIKEYEWTFQNTRILEQMAVYFAHFRKKLPWPKGTRNPKQRPWKPTKFLKDGEKFSFGEFEFSVIEVPGHTEGHLAFHEANKHWLFTGDTLYDSPVWPHYLNFADSSLKAYDSTLKALKKLGPKALIFPAHGTAPLEPKFIDRMLALIEKIQKAEIPLKEKFQPSTALAKFLLPGRLFEWGGISLLVKEEVDLGTVPSTK